MRQVAYGEKDSAGWIQPEGCVESDETWGKQTHSDAVTRKARGCDGNRAQGMSAARAGEYHRQSLFDLSQSPSIPSPQAASKPQHVNTVACLPAISLAIE